MDAEIFTHIKLQTLREFSRVCQNLTSLESCQGRKRFGIETRVFEAKTTIHGVSCEFQRLLFDIVLILDNQQRRL